MSSTILAFFTGLELSKLQADSLLSQLATDWQIEYDAIAELVASAAILYIDETGWKVGKKSCYTWIFSTLSTVLYKCGVGRGKGVITEILGEQFSRRTRLASCPFIHFLNTSAMIRATP